MGDTDGKCVKVVDDFANRFLELCPQTQQIKLFVTQWERFCATAFGVDSKEFCKLRPELDIDKLPQEVFVDVQTGEQIPYFMLEQKCKANEFVVRNWTLMRQIVNTKSKLLFAPLMTKITCDLVSLLDHESIEQVVVGMCNYPEFFWMLISKRMKLLKKLQRLKEKL